jgi:predicted O-methyltransferase YrrM
MNVLTRLARFASAWINLGKFQGMQRPNCTIEEIVDGVFSYSNGFFAPVQVREEIVAALYEIERLQPRNVIEIGTAGGGTLFFWSRVAHPEATIVTIDLPGGNFGGGTSRIRLPLLRHLALPTQKVHFIRASSHDSSTLSQTKDLLNGNRADFLFIDGDHTPVGVRSDFEMFSPLVRRGGIVGFHDIAIQSPEYGVEKLWQELGVQHKTCEFKGHSQVFGIGLLHFQVPPAGTANG